ncbi:MAG: site-2 protease family protein [Bacillota bacterium]
MRLFNLLGTSVGAHPLLLGLLLLAALAGRPREALIAFGSLLAHEVGHLVAARAIGLEVQRVVLWPFGGVAYCDGPAPEPFAEGLLALAGPLANLALLALGGLVAAGGLLHPDLHRFFVQVNLGMTAVNLVPALPLDGGRVGRAWLSSRLGYRQATAFFYRLGTAVGAGLIVAGGLAMAAGRPLVGLLAAGCFILAATVLEREAMPYRTLGQLLRRRRELRGGAVLRGQVLTAVGGTTVGEVLRAFEPHAFQFVIVLEPARLQRLGILTEAQLLEALELRGPKIPLSSLLDSSGDGKNGWTWL